MTRLPGAVFDVSSARTGGLPQRAANGTIGLLAML